MPFAGAKPHIVNDSDVELEDQAGDEELDSFIVDDNGAATAELPLQFSMKTYQDLMHHFKIICQLFVHLAVQDGDDRKSFMKQRLKGT